MNEMYIVIKDILSNDIDYLHRDFLKGEIVTRFSGPTYGCISPKGIAIIDEGGTFLELPVDHLALKEREKLNHSISESIENILSLVREYREKVLSHLHKFGPDYVEKSELIHNGEEVKGNGTEYSDVYQKHFTETCGGDTILCNLFGGQFESEYRQEQFFDEICPNVEMLAGLHWYDFLVTIMESNIQPNSVRDWCIDSSRVYGGELEVIHLILLFHSDSNLMQAWVDVYGYAHFCLAEDWVKFLDVNKSILDDNTQVMQEMMEYGFRRYPQLYNKSPFRYATLGDYWNQVFEPPEKFSDFFRQRPEGAQIYLYKQVRQMRYPAEYKDLGFKELIPMEALDHALWYTFKKCFIFEYKHDHPAVENFIESRDWMFE